MPRRRRNSDRELRELERKAQAGDPRAYAKLKRKLRGMGVLWTPQLGLLLEPMDRVRFKQPWGVFPHAYVGKGETATVYGVEPDGAELLLDDDHPGLAEWLNALQWYEDETTNEVLELAPRLKLPKFKRDMRDDLVAEINNVAWDGHRGTLYPLLYDVQIYHAPWEATAAQARLIAGFGPQDKIRFYHWYMTQRLA